LAKVFTVNIADVYQLFLQHPSIQTDTRKLTTGDIFFALKGPNFNGNLFAQQALAAGAAYVIADEDTAGTDNRIIMVDDVLTTLQQLAKHHRQQFNIPVIAITGSNGKTTTKELVHAVLSSQYITYTTKGNLNNHIGIPLTLLRIQQDAEMAIVEMGANHQKEIESYCTYVLPTHGIITNCGKAHLEGFGGVEGVRKGKGELYDFIRAHKGIIFRYNDYDYLHSMSQGINQVVSYGTTNAQVVGSTIASNPFLQVSVTTSPVLENINTQLVGDYNLPNILCAVAVGEHFGVPAAKIKQALEQYHPDNSRSQMVTSGSNHIILDAYNANPTSMKAAIENFAQLAAPNKVLMLGGMMELGEESKAEHQAILNLIQQHQWKAVVLVGGDFAHLPHGYLYFDTSTQAKEWFTQQQLVNTHLLVKGSRSMQMEKILEP
jgi:UDP-N-acetylmuramoyl-tripeptide--D-alanyl-D-alanine ligase